MPKIYQGVWGVREMTQFTESRQKLFSFSLLPFVCDESSLTQILSISGGRKTTGPPKVNVNDNRTRRNSVSIIILMIVCCQWALFINVQMTTLLYTLQKYIHYPSANYIDENFWHFEDAFSERKGEQSEGHGENACQPVRQSLSHSGGKNRQPNRGSNTHHPSQIDDTIAWSEHAGSNPLSYWLPEMTQFVRETLRN